MRSLRLHANASLASTAPPSSKHHALSRHIAVAPPPAKRIRRATHHTVHALRDIPLPFPSVINGITHIVSSNPLAFQLAAATVAAFLAAAYPNRPRGWARNDLLQVQESPIEGRGVFAKVDIPVGTVVGAFPGRPRTPQQMLAKIEQVPNAKVYCFRNKNGLLLDPTDMEGQPSSQPAPGLPWLAVDPMLAYVNEPTVGSDGVNVMVDDDPNDNDGLVFVTVRPISAGCELFVDYGQDYDRSGYAKYSKKAD